VHFEVDLERVEASHRRGVRQHRVGVLHGVAPVARTLPIVDALVVDERDDRGVVRAKAGSALRLVLVVLRFVREKREVRRDSAVGERPELADLAHALVAVDGPLERVVALVGQHRGDARSHEVADPARDHVGLLRDEVNARAPVRLILRREQRERVVGARLKLSEAGLVAVPQEEVVNVARRAREQLVDGPFEERLREVRPVAEAKGARRVDQEHVVILPGKFLLERPRPRCRGHREGAGEVARTRAVGPRLKRSARAGAVRAARLDVAARVHRGDVRRCVRGGINGPRAAREDGGRDESECA
jgi:hypothetical protein